MKKVLMLAVLLFGVSSQAFATDLQGAKTSLLNLQQNLDLNFPGFIWGRFDQRLNSNDNPNGQTRNGRVMGSLEQGVQSGKFPHVIAYVGANFYQPLAQPTDKYLSLGLKNNTLVPHLTFGLEQQSSRMMDANVSVSDRLVAFANVYLEWGIRK